MICALWRLLSYSQQRGDEKYMKKIKRATLQVRILKKSDISSRQRVCERSPDQRSKNSLRASLTLETALVFPLFLFACVLLSFPFRMMDTHRKMQATVESICKTVAQYAYTADAISAGLKDDTGSVTDKEDDSIPEELKGSLTGMGIGAYAARQAQSNANDPYVSDVYFFTSKYRAGDDMVTIELTYNYNLPFSVFGISAVRQKVSASRRAWIGQKPKSSKDDPNDPTVYVGAHSTRYHVSNTCHYLYNDLTAVSISDVDSKRNQSGGKYYACSRCMKSGSYATVYIMPSGTSYHSGKDCSAIIAHTQTKKLSEVEHLGKCSHCGKGGG